MNTIRSYVMAVCHLYDDHNIQPSLLKAETDYKKMVIGAFVKYEKMTDH